MLGRKESAKKTSSRKCALHDKDRDAGSVLKGGDQELQQAAAAVWAPRTHPGLVELIRHATRVCEDDLPVADDEKQEECVETKEQNDARGLENKRRVLSSWLFTQAYLNTCS